MWHKFVGTNFTRKQYRLYSQKYRSVMFWVCYLRRSPEVFSTYCNIAFLYKKSEATDVAKSIFWMWSNTTSHSVKKLYTDNGGEYITLKLQSFLKEQEFINETITLHIHQQNGYAEQLNCILLEKMQLMQIEAYLLDSWWQFAIVATAYVYNCIPIRCFKRNSH